MLKNKQIKKLYTSFFFVVLAISLTLIGIFMTQFRNDFETSVISSKISSQSNLLPLPDDPIDPGTICSSYVEPAEAQYKGEFVAQEINIQVFKGDRFTVSIYIKNTGNTTWFGDSGNCSEKNIMRLGTAKDQDRQSIFYNPADYRWISANRISMVEGTVEPGEIGTFTFSSNAPKTSDIFREYFQPVVEGRTWLTSRPETAHVDIYAGSNNEEDAKKLIYLGKTGQVSQIDSNKPPIIYVDLTKQKMEVKIGDVVVRQYMVSTGKNRTPTPTGYFKIISKQTLRIAAEYPHYRMPLWQSFTKRGHGLHSLPYLANDKGIFWNEALNHIGQPVSHGCIRLLPEDAEDLYALTQVGFELIVYYS